ncbi:MAG: glycosyltransferase family A protein [Armatimonadota bacterium]
MNRNAASQPQFSVIIATYNRKDYVLQAVRSVVEQTYPAHEIIVVVDGSTDGTAEALRERFPQVKVIEQENAGKCVARNRGIAQATGEWVAFLDHDDLWHREFLERARSYLEGTPSCAALRAPGWFFSEDGGPATGFGLRDFVASSLEECHEMAAIAGPRNDFSYLDIYGRSHAAMLARNCGWLSTTIVKRELAIAAGGFPPSQVNGEDWTFFTNVARLTEWHLLPQPAVFQRYHAGQDTRTLVTGGLAILAGMVNMWHTGRPLPEASRGLEYLETLVEYARTYRSATQSFFWGAVRRGHFRLARLILLCGYLLLPRLRDRLYVLIPPQITWRWERYVLGMHR